MPRTKFASSEKVDAGVNYMYVSACGCSTTYVCFSSGGFKILEQPCNKHKGKNHV